MARLIINIPDNKVPLICAAYGFPRKPSSPAEVRGEIIEGIKKRVKEYQVARLLTGQIEELTKADTDVDITVEKEGE